MLLFTEALCNYILLCIIYYCYMWLFIEALYKYILFFTMCNIMCFNSLRWILLLARFCSAVPKLCPHLEKCVLLQSTSQMDTSLMGKSMTMSMSRSFSKQSTVNPLWSGTAEILSETSLSCYK